MEWTRMLLLDKVFMICAALDFAFIMGTHYMMVKYNWCTEGIALCGRYTTGVMTILSASGTWVAFHPNATAGEAFAIFCLYAIIEGTSTIFFYLVDGMCDKDAAEADLEMVGLGVKD